MILLQDIPGFDPDIAREFGTAQALLRGMLEEAERYRRTIPDGLHAVPHA